MNNVISSKWRCTVLYKSLQILDAGDRKKLLLITVLQSGLAFLDLAGVAAIGLVGALAVTGVQSAAPGNRVSAALELLNLQNFSIQMQVTIIGLLAAALFLTRTVLSIIISRRVLYFLSRRAAKITGNLTSKLLSLPLLKLQERSNQETLYTLTTGVNYIMLGVIGSAIAVIVDLALLILIVSGLFAIDKIMAITTILFFTLLGVSLYKSMSGRAKFLGKESAKVGVDSNEKILEILNSYRELVVKNRRGYYSELIGKTRLKLANIVAEQSFMPNISKYVFESGVIFGALIISALQFLTQDATRAVASLSVFLAASSRLAPAVLRIQSTAVQSRIAIGGAAPTLSLISDLINLTNIDSNSQPLQVDHVGFNPDIIIENISFSYLKSDKKVLENVNLEIKNGEIVAIVGPSGAGKTTLVDIILGVISPDNGVVRISGLEPLQAIENWPGSIAYVPQDVMVSNCSIRENVGLGYSNDEIGEDLVEQALHIAHLYEHVVSLPEGLETNVGDRGTKLSGGQRQRLGIARALFTKPKLLVLDEATSALDGQSESDISDSINDMRGQITVILIAHRLSTVKQADKVVYIEDGKILSIGTFEEVRKNVVNFDKQATLMGL